MSLILKKTIQLNYTIIFTYYDFIPFLSNRWAKWQNFVTLVVFTVQSRRCDMFNYFRFLKSISFLDIWNLQNSYMLLSKFKSHRLKSTPMLDFWNLYKIKIFEIYIPLRCHFCSCFENGTPNTAILLKLSI